MVSHVDDESAEDDPDEDRFYAPEEKFANPRDHMGRTASDVKALCAGNAECKCPTCDHKLIVKSGEKRSTHFAHAPGRKDTSCKGGFETPWHRAAKLAAGLRDGWLHEFTDKTDRHSRFDAYNQFTKQAFEAVHSLSATYVEKQRSLATLGVECQWLFDSAGDFASRHPLPLDVDKAAAGVLECRDLLGRRAIETIRAIGPERCYLHYLGLAWQWIGEDRWRVCDESSGIQQLCIGERGLNRILIDFRARGDMPPDKLAFRNGNLVSTAWQLISPGHLIEQVNEQRSQLIETWRRAERNRAALRRKRNARQFRPSTAEDILCRSLPVCEQLEAQAALTEKLNAIVPEFADAVPSSAHHDPSEDPFARINRKFREEIQRYGRS